MALEFPNQSRGYDGAKKCIRFVGHDSVFEVAVYIEIEALKKIDQLMDDTEQGYFAVFDAARDAVERIARSAYRRRKTHTILIAAVDIRQE